MNKAEYHCIESRRPKHDIVKRSSSLTVSASQSSLIVNIPCEVFIDICKFLSPVDLVTLSTVCKRFRNWLVAQTNFGTEQIWKMSRINWLPHLLPPPNGMSEQCYVFLHLIELGCQFCGSGKFSPLGDLPYDIPAKIYWRFRVRCCQRCFLEKTVTSKQIKNEGRINSDVLHVLPYYAKKDRPFIYWKSQVEAAHQEYMKFDSNDLDAWLCEKSIQLHDLSKIADSCAEPAEAELSKIHIKDRLKLLISQLSLVVPNDAGRPQSQVEVELKRCPTYKKYNSTRDQTAMLAIRLFNENHWNLFQNLIIYEYEERRNYAALRAQQFDIFRKVYSMIPEKFSMNDPIVQYLPYCRTFKKPYFWDATIPFENDFLEGELIRILCEEAAVIAKKPKKFHPITTPDYALKSQLKNRRIFQCKLCLEDRARNDKLTGNFSKFHNHKYRLQCQYERYGRSISEEAKPIQLSDYKTVQLHLRTSLHGIKKIVPEEMIAVDYLAVGKNILKRDSQLVCFFFPFDD